MMVEIALRFMIEQVAKYKACIHRRDSLRVIFSRVAPPGMGWNWPACWLLSISGMDHGGAGGYIRGRTAGAAGDRGRFEG